MIYGQVEPPPPDYGSGQMFDQIATRYDLINRVLAFRMDVTWRRRLTDRIRELLPPHPDEGYRIVDLATGTADVALQLARDLPTTGTRVLGLDPSHNMLELGRQKVHAAGLSDTITLEEADARDLSRHASRSFHAVTMSFGIRNVPPPRTDALCEMHRLLIPDEGVLGILEFSTPDRGRGGGGGGVWGTVATWFIVHVVPSVGGILSGRPREYLHLQRSIRDFPSPDDFRTMLETLDCPGRFDMEPVEHMNFGTVQLYVGRAVTPHETENAATAKDPSLPPLTATTTTAAAAAAAAAAAQ
jgi:demethylmenaquinone methyltransferase/2-methoxy-6-polyprenyl-1,4-benzoquinol methylase